MKLLFILLMLIGCSHQVQKNDVLSEKTKIGVLNYKIKGGKTWEEFSSHLDFMIGKAAGFNSEYLLLPELITLDLFPIDPSDKEIPDLIKGLTEKQEVYQRLLLQLANKYQQNIVGASTFISLNGKMLNRAYYVTPSGISYQDKIYPTPWEKMYGIQSGSELKVFQRNDHRFVILICHDAEFPVLSRELTRLKPEIIFVPSQTDDIHGLERVKRTSMARAVEHMSYVVMTGTTGIEGAPWHSYKGQNFLLTPQNKYFSEPAHGTPEEGWTFFSYDIETIKQARADNKQVYPARDESSWKTAP